MSRLSAPGDLGFGAWSGCLLPRWRSGAPLTTPVVEDLRCEPQERRLRQSGVWIRPAHEATHRIVGSLLPPGVEQVLDVVIACVGGDSLSSPAALRRVNHFSERAGVASNHFAARTSSR